MSAEDKRTTMELFADGSIDVLVSTTVVEVGIDVPNATVMLIEDADRFGLSQLHQLRGRIGRGTWDAELFLITRTRNDEAKARLRLLEQVSDGFELAEADLRMRREGDVLGSRQHGAAALKLIKVLEDSDLIAYAHAEVDRLLDEDLELEADAHAHIAHELQQRMKRSIGSAACAS
jgi:ATP-dependent DNA helicase RecG